MEQISSEALNQALRHDYPQAKIINLKSENNIISFDFDNNTVMVSFVPAPILPGDLETAASSSLLWPEALATLRPHAMHLVVVVTAQTDEIARARVLTQVIASLGLAFSSANGVLWSLADLLIPMKLFRSFAQDLMPKGPPVHLWVKFHAGHNHAQQACAYTRGLAGLGLMDIEAGASPQPVNELGRRLESIAGYLLANGPVIKNGDTLGESGREIVRVDYGPSLFDNPHQVMHLNYAAKKKPFWKIW
jgi:hypothetical protein